jgi:hypothetical protein
MANNDRPTLQFITPRGTAVFPKLNQPDTKFDANGVYETKLKLEADAADGQIGKSVVALPEIVEKLEAIRDQFLAEKKAELAGGKDPKQKAKAKNITARAIGEPAYDDDGEETGELILKAKMKASGISAKDNKPWTRKPVIFDAKGKKLSDVPLIYGGSTLKVAVKAVPYYMAAENEVGVSLYLEAVQVIDLVSGGGGRSASAYGFGSEDGYVAEDEEEGQQFNDAGAAGAEDDF